MQRRDAAIIAVFRPGIRLADLAVIRYDPDDTQCSDVDLWQREITVRGKSGRPGSSGSATKPPRP